MQELKQLLKKYQNEVDEATLNLEKFEENFKGIDLGKNLLGQISASILSFLKSLIVELNLTSDEKESFDLAYEFYKKNSDLNLENLVIKDVNLENYLKTIARVWRYALDYRMKVLPAFKEKVKKSQDLLDVVNNILNDLKSEDVINIDSLIENIKKVSLSDDTIILILREANLKNLKYYKHVIKEIKKPLESEKTNIDNLKQCQEALSNLKTSVLAMKNDEKKYLLESKLVVMEDSLNLLKSEYQEYLDLEKEDNKDLDVLDDYLTKLNEEINEFKSKIDSIIKELESDSLKDCDLEQEKSTLNNSMNLIFLDKIFEDMDEFLWGKCQPAISYKAYNMLKKLKREIAIPNRNKSFAKQKYPINKMTTTSSLLTPIIFYQIVEQQVIVLLLGIKTHDDYQTFNNTLLGRLKKNQEYKRIITAIENAKQAPNEMSKYDSKISNQEFLNKLLIKYREVEDEFMDCFQNRCCLKKSERVVK